MDSEKVNSLSIILDGLNASMEAYGRLDLEGVGSSETLDQFQLLIDKIEEDRKHFNQDTPS